MGGKKAWSMLCSLGKTIQLTSLQPRQDGNQRKTVYNPYKKRYDIRSPTIRRSKKVELQMVLKENEHPTDHIWIGDKMSEDRPEGVIRMWVQNWNGAERKDVEMMKYQLSTLVDNNINYFSIIESKLNQYHKVAKRKWDTAKESIMPHGEISITSTPGYPIHKTYQPGGIISGLHGKLQSRLSTTKRDTMGRWHYHHFYGKKRDLRIYSIYRVNKGQKENKGDTTAWTQQKNLLDLNNDDRNPRQAVIDDFLEEIQKAITKEYSIIIMGDINEAINDRENTNKKLRDLGLLNLMEEYVGADAMPRTCKKGSQAIDHIWITGNILSTIHSAGYAPFDFLKVSDHRGLFFDFYYKEILDDDLFHLESHSKKRLKSSIPARVEKYMEVILDKWEENKFEERFRKISQNFQKNGKTHENEEALNILDTQITEVMINAEKKCSKVPTCRLYAWSIKLKNAMRDLVDATTARTKAQKIRNGDNITNAIETFRKRDEEWKAMKKECKEVQKRDKQERTSHIDECAAKNVENDPTLILSKEIRRLKHIEEQREQALRMKYVLKPFSKKGVTTIQIPAVVEYSIEQRNEEGFDHHNIDIIWNRILPKNGNDIVNWERVTEKNLVQSMLLQWQRKHFTQANETPLASTQWNDILCDKKNQDNILSGQFIIPDDTPEEIKEIFESMKRHEKVKQEIAYASTMTEFLSFIRGASEKTSTSPSGRGYNHYKSLVKGGGMKQIKMIHSILELARTHGIILRRWKKTVTTLMEKDVGRPRIHRMRALHIIEAEVQFLAKLFYCKKLMDNAEKHDMITKQQHGGRKNKQAQTAVINKLLYYNIAHQQLLNAAFIDDDARNCYDRIITALSAVEMRSWGQSFEEAEFSVNFLQNQEYHVRTGLGVTSDSYTYSRDDPTHGSGQGIGWAGVKFTRTSDTISKIMGKKCTGMHFQDPEGKYNIKRNADFFVDDTALGVAHANMSENESIASLQRDQQKHAYLLFATGHKLALDKCHYYWVSFIREGTRHRHKLIHEMPGDLKIKPGYNMDEVIIRRNQPFQSHKTLGCQIAVDMNQKGQIRIMKKKIQEWCNKMKTSYLRESDMQYAYSGYVKMAIRYILSTTTMTYNECNDLMKLMEPILLHSFRFHKNCNRNILYMPIKYGGIGIKHMYHLQGQEKLRFFMMHLRRNDDTGKLIKASIEWTQLESGLSTHIFSEICDTLQPFITPTWVTHLWKYINDCGCKINIKEMKTKLGVRANDFFLMDIIRGTNLSIEQKQIFNQIRLYMQVETAADIVKASNGTQICNNIYECVKVRRSTKLWPNIKSFPRKWKEIWVSILRNHIQPILQSRPLGKWKRTSHQCWTFPSNGNFNIFYDGDNYVEKVLEKNEYIPTVDIQANLSHEIIVLHIYEGYERINMRAEEPMTTQAVPLWVHRNWGTLELEQNIIDRIGKELHDNNIVAASDGSVWNKRSSHAFCIATKDEHEIIFKAAAPVDCDHTHASSFRAESFGALAIITLLEYIGKQLNMPRKRVDIYIDNSETVQTMNKKLWHTVGTVLNDDRDVAIELRSQAKNGRFSYSAVHVKGHMDRITDDLTPEQWLNQQMDTHVGEFIRSPPPRLLPTQEPPVLPSSIVGISCNGAPVVSNIEETLIENMLQDGIEEYYAKHHQIQNHHMDVIDYVPLRQVLKKNKKKLGPRLKCINHQWHTMAISYQWKATTDPLCPLCRETEETWQHIFSCTHCEMKRARREQRKKLEEKLTTLHTMPDIKKQILGILDAWSQNKQPQYIPSTSQYREEVELAFKVQEEVGFSSFIVGLISTEWGDAQEVYFRREIKDSKYNTIRWRQGLIEALITYATMQWKERCDYIHAENNATKDQRFRKMLKLKLQYLKQNKSTIHQSDYFLLAKTDAFFEKCDTANLEMWYIRVQIAIARQEKRVKQKVGDIRKYGQIRTRRKRKRTRTYDDAVVPKQYKQLTITDQFPVPSLQKHHYEEITRMENNEIRQRRLRLEKLVTKRKMRQRSILEHTQEKKKRKCTNDPTMTIRCPRNDSSMTDHSPRNDRKVNNKKRKNTKYILVTTARKRLRKSGREPKTDR